MSVLEKLRSSFSKGMSAEDKATLEKLIGQDTLSSDDQKAIEAILAKEENKAERPKIIAALKEKFTGEAHASLQIFLEELETKLGGYSLTVIGERLKEKDAKTLFGIYSSTIGVLLSEAPETKDLKPTEKESLKIVLWKLFSQQFSASGVLSKSIQGATAGLNQDALINGGLAVLTDGEGQTPAQKPDAKSGELTGEELKQKLKATYEAMSGNFKLFLAKCPAESREKIITYPSAIESIIQTGKFSNDKGWNIDVTDEKGVFITPDLNEKVIVGDQVKYITELAKSSDEVFAQNGKWKKFAVVLGYLEDSLKSWGFIGAFIASIIAAIRKVLGGFDKINIGNLFDSKVKTSLENLQKFATNPETAKLNIKNVGFLAGINAESGKEFFAFLKGMNVDIKDVNFWPLITSGKNADGSAAGDKLKDGTPLKKVADFFQKRLSDATTQDEFIGKIKGIKEADEFKDTKSLETVATEALKSGTSFPITIEYNGEKTVVNVEENPQGLIVVIGSTRFQIKDIKEYGKYSGASVIENGNITALNYVNNSLQFKTTFSGSETLQADEETVKTMGLIIARLMEKDITTYTTEKQITAGEFKLGIQFDKLA